MKRHLSFAMALAVLTLIAGMATSTFVVGSAQNAPAPGATASPLPGMPDMPGMMHMKGMHERMMAEMKASDAKLDALVQQMNAAKGDGRIDALVAAVNELARQSKAERAHMLDMHQMMMREHETATVPDLHAH